MIGNIFNAAFVLHHGKLSSSPAAELTPYPAAHLQRAAVAFLLAVGVGGGHGVVLRAGAVGELDDHRDWTDPYPLRAGHSYGLFGRLRR